MGNDGGYQYRVSYYNGTVRGGAHLFNDKRDAKKFAARNWFRSPELFEGKRSADGLFRWRHVS